MAEYPEYISPDNALKFVSDDGGENYNMCHYWSNFEIADMDFFRSDAYTKFFEYLDSKGGFYYERWGDAPVHTIAISLLARKEQVHFFENIGYRHKPLEHCPIFTGSGCTCDQSDTIDYTFSSCLRRFNVLTQ
ncbi:glycosyltransferase family 15 protein [Athelia psychrophila]|uniref:Glycosyltransferase family 15 protein n=1 Tax=Athelia psychrophila TaxID=1759441 RepID=A0A167T5J2_9AGAM|nr:glycosyltransferase family 15 protein [Fibularhizoctonia sp. CBS 109695]